MIHLRCNENWNGTLLADCFPILRPANEGWKDGETCAVFYKGKYAGTAVVRTERVILWKDISDHASFLLVSKPAYQLKSVLRTFYGFGKIDPLPTFPVFYGIAQWTERDLGTTAMMFEEEWKKCKKKMQEPETKDEYNQEPLFTVDHD
jgi:hypothetical protein